MAPALAVPLFIASLAVTLLAAASFARRLDRLGARVGLPEALIGVLTALAADAPELSSAVVALAKGEREVGVGVVLGSNVFNLAAMIGVSAVVAGKVKLRREALLLEGVVALGVTLISAALIAHWLAAWTAVVLLAVILVPYLHLLRLGPAARRLRLPERMRETLGRAVGETIRHPTRTPSVTRFVWMTELLILPVVGLIVLGSIGMVQAAVSLSDNWSISRVLVGTLLLAGLTSLPNAFTALRLGLAGRGSALVSETLNSNTINFVGGIAVPTLFITLAPLSGLVLFDLLWLIGMTAVAIALLAHARTSRRAGGTTLIVLYAVYVAVHIAQA